MLKGQLLKLLWILINVQANITYETKYQVYISSIFITHMMYSSCYGGAGVLNSLLKRNRFLFIKGNITYSPFIINVLQPFAAYNLLKTFNKLKTESGM